MSASEGYFAPTRRTVQDEIRRDLIVGGILILFAIAIFFIPRAAVTTVLFVFSLLLLANGLRGVWQLSRGKIIPHLRPQVIAQTVGNLVAFAVIVVFPFFTLDIVVILGGLLLIARGLLAVASFIGNDYISVGHRRWLIVMAIFSFAVGIFLLTSNAEDMDLVVLLIAVFSFLEGLDYLADARSLMRSDHQEASDSPVLSEAEIANNAKWTPLAKDDPGLETVVPTAQSANPKPTAKQMRGWLSIDTSKYKRPLFITPHPDDLEGFAGGLAYMLDSPVTSVVMSGGNKGVFTEEFMAMPERDYMILRLDESIDAGELLGVGQIVYMGFKDRTVTCNEESIEKLSKLFDDYKPDLVVSFEYYKYLTPYPHPDHIATANIAKNTVARKSEEFPIDYMLISTFAPNHFIDISGARKVKLEALACHTTQAGLNAIIFPIFERLFTRMWGLFTNVRYAEGYRQVNIPKMKEKLVVQAKES